MPFFDQHWRLRWLGAWLAGVAAVLLPLRYLQVAAVWDHVCGLDMQLDDLFAGGTAVALVGVAFLLARSARRARERMQWRTQMLAGVNPPHHRASRSTSSARAAPERHTIVQRIGIVDRVIGWMSLPLFIPSIPVTFLVLALALEVLINPAAPACHGDSGPVLGPLLIAVPAMAVSVWVFGTIASDAWAPSPRFEIDQFGITWMRPRGRSVTIRWQNARLLESATYFRPEGRTIERKVRYLLYGNDTVMRIDSARGNLRVVEQLLELIEEHTGLVPRKLDQSGLRERLVRRLRLRQ